MLAGDGLCHAGILVVLQYIVLVVYFWYSYIFISVICVF
jgi:hypothetical protein